LRRLKDTPELRVLSPELELVWDTAVSVAAEKPAALSAAEAELAKVGAVMSPERVVRCEALGVPLTEKATERLSIWRRLALKK
jgi:hypothetical protein